MKPARTFPYKLDPFQENAIHALERNESVLVAAHTSAGKTTVAEYAIAMAFRDNQRVVYTSPIKALSNQKYREMQEIFTDVGLMTGDVTINETATCLIMTTEILRNMLYKGSEVMREVAWVVFDEIHYMRDKERGVVWEETLVLLPHSVRCVFLSATIPNAEQFARWIEKIHGQRCQVFYTDYRPTPLQHFIATTEGKGLSMIVDEKGVFYEDRLNTETMPFNKKEGFRYGRRDNKLVSSLKKVIRLIETRSLSPAIVFSFARKRCEENAISIGNLDFNTAEEKQAVETIYQNAIHSLGEADRNLPQISNIVPFLKKGIGIHHSGLLPILKELTEILFQEGLLKILFATETFAIGLNMPAKTVVFTSIRKFDGQETRWLSPGEYIQMSGRAGRRGIDESGIVVVLLDRKVDGPTMRKMAGGSSDQLDSAFYLSYNMILNLIRVDSLTPEELLTKSFNQFQVAEKSAALEEKIEALKQRRFETGGEEASEVEGLEQKAAEMEKELLGDLLTPENTKKVLDQGRIVKVAGREEWCCVFRLLPGRKNVLEVLEIDQRRRTLDLRRTAPESVVEISSQKILLPKEVATSKEKTKETAEKLIALLSRKKNEMKSLDLLTRLSENNAEAKERLEKIAGLYKEADEIKNSPQYKAQEEKAETERQIETLQSQVRSATAIIHFEELQKRKAVLRRLQHINENDTVEIKGNVACEVRTGDELLLTEFMFSGFFAELSPEQIAALLSCLVFEERSEEQKLTRHEELKKPFSVLQEIAKKIAAVTREAGMDIDEEKYLRKVNPSLMDVVYSWANGASFSQICSQTEVFEGSIIRTFKRLEELLRELEKAMASIGNTDLQSKFAGAIEKIKRDIIFSNSLYL
ncbi:MAG: ATP-dependent RNA helicase, TRAMP complex subunit Mtr4 [Amphiamblys sp. WSBS2006]|nr:MAG: ATP-dependent RNA helicase, TRAMP complex subunit Mtr4 [Amphiamblys sp. WSBS2006]